MGDYAKPLNTPYRSSQKLHRDNALSEITSNSTLKALALTNLGLGTGASAPTASTVALRDANANLSANNVLENYATTATAAGTTTLTVGSAYQQYFTGSTTQTVVLPVVSTLALGQQFNIVNNSTGVVTVQSSGANSILALQAGASALFTVVSISGTGTSSWSYSYQPSIQTSLNNFSTTSQSPAATTRTYITGSQMAIPPAGLRIGTILRWKLNMTKTAAGSATSTFDVAFGTAGTTADTAVLSFTKPAGTAAADEGFVEVEAIVRGPLGASAIATGEFVMFHNLASTGHAVIPTVVVNTVSSTFNSSTPTFVGLCITTGASDSITIQQVTANASNL